VTRDRKGRAKAETIRGLVIAVEWHEDGRVKAVGLSAHGENDYLLADNQAARELVALVGREVEVSGPVGQGEQGRRVVAVTKYRPTGGPWRKGWRLARATPPAALALGAVQVLLGQLGLTS
jgi:hypothetical protein